MGLSRAPEMTGREALWRVVRETTEDRRRRPQVNPTTSASLQSSNGPDDSGRASALGGFFAHSSAIAARSIIRERLHRRVMAA